MSGDHNQYQKASIKGEGGAVYSAEEIASAPPQQPDDGGPAFPTPKFELNENGQVTSFAIDADGMFLRDYFAAKAMQGIVSREISDSTRIDKYAENAYKMADAMLKARSA